MVAGFVTSAHAWNYTASGQWASFTFGNWTVYQDEWGSTAYCELYANSQYNFAAAGSWTGGGIKTYPHTQVNVDIPISSSYYCNSTFNFTGPNNPWWDFFYDAYTGSMQDELEIIEGWNVVGTPTWGTQVAANVTIAGKLMQPSIRRTMAPTTCSSSPPPASVRSSSEAFMAFFIWHLNSGLLHNSTLHQVSFGTEITYTSGWQQFTCNSYSLNWGQNTTSYHRLQNRATGLYVDGMGYTSNGANCCQYSSSGSANQSWALVANGSYVQIRNQATGMMIDGEGRTSNGSACGQFEQLRQQRPAMVAASHRQLLQVPEPSDRLVYGRHQIHRQWLDSVPVQQQQQQ